jgi:pimeloyl-ACP methyl ester carboxylesterase
LYPTAQPFWISAAMLRRDLAEVRRVLDPQHREPALDQMVLIGHSMGGLLARLQTVASGNAYWRAVSDEPLEMIKAAPDVRQRLRDCFFFQPNPSIRKVITLGTPCRGTSVSNETTQWLAAQVIRLPSMLLQSQEALFHDNKDAFPATSLLRISNSVDALSPHSPIFAVLDASPHPPWVTYHNIIGMVPHDGLWGRFTRGDGLVDYASAHMDDVASELIVPTDHSGLLTHPLAVLEVRRILLEHLAELRAFPNPASPPPMMTAASVMPH